MARVTLKGEWSGDDGVGGHQGFFAGLSSAELLYKAPALEVALQLHQ
jgi:hypothetical protein